MVALLGAALAVLPGIAASESLPVNAVNEGLYYHHWSNAVQTIIAGETVKFANPSEVAHGLQFTGGPATPSCSGIPSAATEPGGATNWHGECSFSTPGSYTFICTVHPTEMRGTITVDANGTTTVTTTGTPTSTPPPSPSSEPAVVSSSPLSGAPSLRASQRGGSVKGALPIAKSGAGDELRIDVFAAGAALGRPHSKRVRVAELVRASVRAGRLPFSIRLDARARRALARRHRLALTVRIVLTPAHGQATTVTRSVLERP